MKKNGIFLAAAALMLLVILAAAAKKTGILEKMEKMEQMEETKNENGTQKTAGKMERITDQEEIERYEMGEEALCGAFLLDQPEMIEKESLYYTVHSAVKTGRISNIPEKYASGILGMTPDGYAEEGMAFIVTDITIRNPGNSVVEHYLNCASIMTEPGTDVAESTLSCYSELEGCQRKDYFRIELSPGEEYHTKLVFLLEEQDIKEEMYMKVNPRGSSSSYDGAAVFRLEIKADGMENGTDI